MSSTLFPLIRPEDLFLPKIKEPGLTHDAKSATPHDTPPTPGGASRSSPYVPLLNAEPPQPDRSRTTLAQILAGTGLALTLAGGGSTAGAIGQGLVQGGAGVMDDEMTRFLRAQEETADWLRRAEMKQADYEAEQERYDRRRVDEIEDRKERRLHETTTRDERNADLRARTKEREKAAFERMQARAGRDADYDFGSPEEIDDSIAYWRDQLARNLTGTGQKRRPLTIRERTSIEWRIARLRRARSGMTGSTSKPPVEAGDKPATPKHSERVQGVLETIRDNEGPGYTRTDLLEDLDATADALELSDDELQEIIEALGLTGAEQ